MIEVDNQDTIEKVKELEESLANPLRKDLTRSWSRKEPTMISAEPRPVMTMYGEVMTYRC